MKHPFLQLSVALAAMAAAAMAAERGGIYLPAGLDEAKARAIVEAAIPEAPEGWEVECHVLTDRCKTVKEAHLHARAIEAGVHELPCLVLADDAGPYAVLPLHDLQARDVEKARALAHHPERKELYKQRLFNAKIYLLCARTALCDQLDAKGMENTVRECRKTMAHPMCTTARKQFLGLYCLYPMLMRQYAAGYTGAHTPETEAKLLEAIAALEEARDLDPDSKLGMKAYDERERLRAARREARKYE